MVRPAGWTSNRYTLDDMPDLSGQVAIVVGGSRGIGEATTQALVQKGSHVHILSATQEHMDQAIENTSELTPDAPSLITTHAVDLGDLNALQSVAQKLAGSLERLDGLYLIAGIGVAPWGLTKDGLGNHFGVNNVAQVLLADVFYPVLRRTAETRQAGEEGRVRIVSETSELHRSSNGDVKAENLHEMGEGCKDQSPLTLYGRSKLCNIWLMSHLATLLPRNPPILAISVHPGAVETEQQAGALESYPIIGTILQPVSKLFKTKEQGAEATLWAGTAPGLGRGEEREEVQGRYFTEPFGETGTESDQAKDTVTAARFWQLCVDAIKEKTGYEVKLGWAA